MSSPSGKAPIPRSVPDYVPTSWVQNSHFSARNVFFSNKSQPVHKYQAISPPISRSGSTDESSSALIEDWRRYTDNLREQFKGERAHLIADRERADEIMAEEREINDQERSLLREESSSLRLENAQLRQIVAAYESRFGQLDDVHMPAPTASQAGIISPPGLSFLNRPGVASPIHRPVTLASLEGSALDLDRTRLSPRSTPTTIIQETGREGNGAPIWAPESEATRSFDNNDAVNMDMASVTSGENPLRVPIREFHPDDFRVLSPEEHKAKEIEASEAGSVAGDGVPGEQISPQLDGVILRESAVAPTFKIKSPSPSGTPLGSPPVRTARAVSPTKSIVGQEEGEHGTEPQQVESADAQDPLPLQDTTNRSIPLSRHSSEGRQTASELLRADPGDRLVANAGHTPVHSRTVSKVESDYAQSGNATPTRNGRQRQHDTSFDQDHTEANSRMFLDGVVPEEAVIDEALDEDDDGDRVLASPLAMGHKANRGDSFILSLDQRLAALAEEQARRGSISSQISELDELTGQLGPSSHGQHRSTSASDKMTSPDLQELEEEIKPLRIKQSLNFGQPFGRRGF